MFKEIYAHFWKGATAEKMEFKILIKTIKQFLKMFSLRQRFYYLDINRFFLNCVFLNTLTQIVLILSK